MMSAKRMIICLFLLSLPSLSFGAWSSQQEIITGTWGTGQGQFYYSGASDTDDFFPRSFGIDKDGNILIADEGNKRLLIYNNDGSIKKILTKPADLPAVDSLYGWPSALTTYSGGNSIIVTCQYQQIQSGIQPLKECFLDYNGTILAKVDVGQVFPIDTGFVILRNNIYTLYSPTGQLIKTSTTKPPELGILQSQKIAAKQFKVTVTYPDRSWSTVRGNESLSFKRDSNGNFYGLNNNTAVRYNSCGKELGRITMPKLQYQNTATDDEDLPPTPPDAEAPRPPVALEYGAPVLAPNGDVYTWKRTPDKYSIVKWTWQDDPNTPTGPDAPANLKVEASTDGLYLTWSASPQDPGCVTGYEVSRSTTTGGTFSVITTTDKGVLNYNDTTADAGTTYYYKLRAKAGNDFSAYTTAASGTR